MIERWNRSILQKISRHFTTTHSYRYIDVIDILVHKYNSTYHSTINMTPFEASIKSNECLVHYDLYGDVNIMLYY